MSASLSCRKTASTSTGMGDTTSHMADRIRTADPVGDRALLTDLLSLNLGPDAVGRRFDWLYLANPHGPARVWVAIEEGTNLSVAAAAAFPRRLFVGKALQSGYVLGDFCIAPQRRSLGLALQMQRACLEQIVAAAPLATIYDFPSDSMMAIYRRMKVSPASEIVRWAKPLRANRKIANVVSSPALADLLSVPFNLLGKLRDFASLPSGEWTVTQHEGLCNEDFTNLAHTIGAGYGSCVERSAEYLNWRYLGHPLVHHEILTARKGGQLRGYVVFSCTNEDAKIVDLFGFSNTAMWASLMARVVALLRERRVVTLSMPALSANPWTGHLKSWGFQPREAAPVVVYAAGAAAPAQNDSNWFLMDGDRES